MHITQRKTYWACLSRERFRRIFFQLEKVHFQHSDHDIITEYYYSANYCDNLNMTN